MMKLDTEVGKSTGKSLSEVWRENEQVWRWREGWTGRCHSGTTSTGGGVRDIGIEEGHRRSQHAMTSIEGCVQLIGWQDKKWKNQGT